MIKLKKTAAFMQHNGKVPLSVARILYKTLILGCAMLFLSCSAHKVQDGTYTSSANGHNGPIEVTVEFSKGAIKNVDIVSHFESVGVQSVLNVVPERIVKNQSVAVDTVSGATFAGRAVISAVEQCIKDAGGKPDSWKKAVKSEKPSASEYEADVIVIGAGGAGLSAALSAHQNGAKVIVLEKLGFPGGSTIFSAGAFNAADPVRAKTKQMSAANMQTVENLLKKEPFDEYEASLQKAVRAQFGEHRQKGYSWLFDSPEFHALQTYNGGDYKGNPALIDILAQKAPEAVEWTASNGASFRDTLGMATGALWQRSHYGTKEFPNGSTVIYPAVKYIQNNNGIDLHLNTQALELVKNDGKVTGVKAKMNGYSVMYKAGKAVIIATGGFGANVDMRQKYNSQWADLGKKIGCSNQSRAAQGEGIVMGEKAGAQLIDMGFIQLHPNGEVGTGMMMGQPHTSGLNRIFVNNNGERFVAEDARRDVLVNAIYAQPDGTMWIVADANRYPERDSSIANFVTLGKTLKASNVAELAALMKVPADKLQQSIDEYNRIVDGENDRLGLKTYGKKLGVAPFYAAKRVPTVHHTMGGLKIDTQARVLDKDNNAIPGLYAAGEVTGGIHGANRLGGNAIADITVFGRIAGTNAAKE